MAKRLELIGKKFHRLTVVSFVEMRGKHSYWICKCECGKETITRRNNLMTGHTKSCGCFQKEKLSEETIRRNTTHGKRHSAEYNSWRGMVQRCTNTKQEKYATYGARGIKVCERWLKFENFYQDMGDKPSPKHSIERIDNEGNYEPSNCKWATPIEQMNNTRRNKNYYNERFNFH
jgi:hypothetical protein